MGTCGTQLFGCALKPTLQTMMAIPTKVARLWTGLADVTLIACTNVWGQPEQYSICHALLGTVIAELMSVLFGWQTVYASFSHNRSCFLLQVTCRKGQHYYGIRINRVGEIGLQTCYSQNSSHHMVTYYIFRWLNDTKIGYHGKCGKSIRNE